MTYELKICKHFRRLVNQGVWWCDKQSDKGDPNIGYYLNCDCNRCPRRLDEDNIITCELTVSESYNEQT